jgi:hypothetical protein
MLKTNNIFIPNLNIKMYRKEGDLVPVGSNRFAAFSKDYVHATPEELEKYFPKIGPKKELKNNDADKVVSPDTKGLDTANVAKKL